MCSQLQLDASKEQDRFAFCRAKYVDALEGRLAIPEPTEEAALYIKTCCLGGKSSCWDRGVFHPIIMVCVTDLRARANVPSEYNDIVENEDPTLIKRRTYFPHVWLQDEVISNGLDIRHFAINFTSTKLMFCCYRDLASITKHVTVPDSITEWSIYGLAQCCATGFCVSEPVSLRVFKPLFVECHLPYALKRQEQVSIACTAYNYNAFEQRVNISP